MPESILYLEGVTVSFDGFKALNNVNFYMDPGELRVVIGPNGAGKTTLLDVICGKVKPAEGRVIFGEMTDVVPLREHEIVKLGIGRKFQTPSILRRLTVLENLELAVRRPSKGVWAMLRRGARPGVRERIEAALEAVRLKDKRFHVAETLSHGEKQWLEIGMVMAQDPKVMLIDEPVAGMTDRETGQTAELLLALAGHHSVLVIEHDMNFVKSIARKVTVLHEGQVLCEGPFEQIQSDPRVIEIYLGGHKRHARN